MILFRNSIEAEMKKVLQSSALPFVVHYVRPNDGTLDSFPLPKITKLYSNIPVFIIAYSQGTVEARCCVPKVNCNFQIVKLNVIYSN